MTKRTSILCGLFCALVVAATLAVHADSAAQIYVSNSSLQYVKHVNDLPSGTTTLLVRSILKLDQQARIKFSARAEDGSQLSRTTDVRFRPAEEKKIVINWGQPITDLNFIQIIVVQTSRDGNSGRK